MSEKKRKEGSLFQDDLSSKEQKKALKRAEKVAKSLGYSNETNPFGDSNLSQPFIWKKKDEKEKKENKKSNPYSIEKRIELMEEINRVRERREKRENELLEMEKLRDEESRLRELASFGDWKKKEEEFHIQQTRVRSKIRLAESREQPIDLIAKNIILLESAKVLLESKEPFDRELSEKVSSLDIEVRHPLSLIQDLSLTELESLLPDVDSNIRLETLSLQNEEGGDHLHLDFWKAVQVVVESEVKSRSGRSTVHPSVREEMRAMLKNKDEKELSELEEDIQGQLRSNKSSSGFDVEYWERLLGEVQEQRARATLSTLHASLLRKQLDVLTQLKPPRPSRKETEKEDGRGRDGDRESERGARKGKSGLAQSSDWQESEVRDDEELERFALQAEAADGEEGLERLGVSSEVRLPGETHWWQDRHRPRKPRYFNRVKTGWDWNKYNQTHYDHDNPPPKVIQGYKFTVFYPDLIDKSKTPQYFIEPCAKSDEEGWEKDFVVLRFHAGPPYEDVAFRILNKEWDTNKRSGFRCTFDRGVLQLHFNFKRQFYVR